MGRYSKCCAGLIFLVLSMVLSSVAAGPFGSGPRIEFASRIHPFGTLRPGPPMDYSFIFTNTGDAVLLVSNVQPSCGCTTPGDWTKMVSPGQTGIIPLRLNTKRASGPVNVTVRVTSNDPALPEAMLKLAGKIWRMVDASPQYVLFNLDEKPGTNTVRLLDITNNSDQPVSLSTPVLDVTNFIVELATNVPGWDYRLSVRLASLDGPAQVQGLITLKTSCTNEPVLPVSAIIIRPSAQADHGQTAPPAEDEAAKRLAANHLQWLDDRQAARLFQDPGYAQHRIIFVDARSDEEYQAGHIPGAWQFDPYHPEKYALKVLPACRDAERVVVYCAGRDCEDSEMAALILRGAGVENQKLFVYVNGLAGWKAGHLPVETSR